MITKVYAHILDEDRKINAQKFENAFYSINTDLRDVKPPQEETKSLDVTSLIEQLRKSPELVDALAAIIAAKSSC